MELSSPRGSEVDTPPSNACDTDAALGNASEAHEGKAVTSSAAREGSWESASSAGNPSDADLGNHSDADPSSVSNPEASTGSECENVSSSGSEGEGSEQDCTTSSTKTVTSRSSSAGSVVSTLSSARPSTGVNDHFSPRLASALAAMDYAFPPYYGDERALPNPGLVVEGLSEPLALPLVPAQAEELAGLSNVCASVGGYEDDGDECITKYVRVEPDQVKFENPDWDRAMEELFDVVCCDMGLAKCHVKCELGKVMMHRTGGWLKSHAHAHGRKREGVFARLAIQLPCYFSGGEVILRYNGKEKEFRNGAEDGKNRFKSFYTWCFVDVEQEIRSIKEGNRLTVVYDLSWIGKGGGPIAEAEPLAEVAAALVEHADKSAVGDWHLAFMLEREYTSALLSDCGTRALEGVDRRNVGALSAAAEMLGIGELDFVLCRLSQEVTKYGKSNVVPFEYSSEYTDDVNVKEAYWDTGEAYTGDLNWVSWDFASFTPEDHKGPDVERRPRIETVCYAMAVIAWANSMEVETLFKGSTYEVGCYLADDVLSDPSETRADRILACVERGYSCDVYEARSWTRTRDILEFCLERDLHEQASRGIRIAATFDLTEDIETVLFRYVLRHGWEVIGEALEEYLCSPEIPMGSGIVGRLQTLLQLIAWMSVRVALCSLTMAVMFVEFHECRRFRRCYSWGDCDLKWHHGKIWVTLMSVIVELECKASEAEISSILDDLAVRLAMVMQRFDERQIERIYQALSQRVIGKPSKYIAEFLAASRRRLLSLKIQRFAAMVNFVTVHSTTFPSGYIDDVNAEIWTEGDDQRSDCSLEDDWTKLLSFSSLFLPAMELRETSSRLIKTLTDAIVLIPNRQIDVLEKVVSGLDGGSEEEEFFSLIEDRIGVARRNMYERSSDSRESESSENSPGSDHESD